MASKEVPVCYVENPYVYTGYQGILSPNVVYDPSDVKGNASVNMRNYLCRFRRMIKLKEGCSLPDTIPERQFVLMWLTLGHNIIAEYEGKPYFFHGQMGGKPDPYYLPEDYIVANPALKLSRTYHIDKDCALIRSDSMYTGILPTLSKYCFLMAQNELTMNVVDIMARSSLVMEAEDDKDLESARQYIKDLEKGKLGVVTKHGMINGGVETQPGATDAAAILPHLIELNQYFKSALVNEYGLNANWNAKREYVGESEQLLNEDALWPLVDDMLNILNDDLKKANEMFGLNIEFEFDSSWKYNDEERELEKEIAEQQAEGGDEQQEGEEQTEEKDEGGEDKDEKKEDA